MDLKDKSVMITGGSSGIGYETAKLCVKRGAKVMIIGRNESALQLAAAKLGASYCVADVSKEEDCQRMVKQTLEQFGALDVLVNNAGFGYFAPLIEMDLDKMKEVYATNVFGAMLAAKYCALHFVSQQSGNIINISSTAGRSGFAMGGAYSSSKFALTSMTECWRAELRKHNIRVMQVNPSEVQTQFVPNSGGEARPYNETKLHAVDIAHAILSMLEMEDRGFITELTVFATNPK